jgi:hypothetical protein
MSVQKGLSLSAVEAAERGWHVFPCRAGDKRPALHAGERCPRSGACVDGHVTWEARATTDLARVKACWAAGPFNVGVATGPSGLVVIDLDLPKAGQFPPPQWLMPGVNDGFDAFAVVCERAGQPLPVDTFTVTTGRGGTHLYFRAPQGLRLRNTRGDQGSGLGWLIDTRAHGGYVLGPGSIVAGRPYEISHDAPVAELPAWLAARLAPAPVPPAAPVSVPVAASRVHAYGQAAIAREVSHITSAPDHHNDALFAASVALGQLVAGGVIAAADARRELERAGLVVKLRHGAVLKTIASGFKTGSRQPRKVK